MRPSFCHGGICGAFPDCRCGRAGQGYYPQAAASHDGPVSGGGQGNPDHRAGTVLSDVHEKEYYENLIQIALHPQKPVLTDVMLETLSIIAYKQPVTKAEIEKIRGVKCDHAINKLMEYELVRELGRLDAPGRPILLGTTEEFLRSFGVQALDELPVMDPVQLEDFKAEAEEEIQLKLDV